MSLTAAEHGEFWTVPFVCGSEQISLNVKCGVAGYVRAGIERVAGDYDNMGTVQSEAIEGFGLADCEPVTGDHVDGRISWKGRGVTQLLGQTVRMHLQLREVDLHAIKF